MFNCCMHEAESLTWYRRGTSARTADLPRRQLCQQSQTPATQTHTHTHAHFKIYIYIFILVAIQASVVLEDVQYPAAVKE